MERYCEYCGSYIKGFECECQVVPKSTLRKLVERWRNLRYSDAGSEYENGILRCVNELETYLK